MDGIQPYGGSSRPPAPVTASFSVTPTLVKTPSDYFRALRRRIWLVLAVSVPLGATLTILTLKQPAIYRAAAQIQIQPPQYDPVLTALVKYDSHRDNEGLEHYIPNRLALLKSRTLAEAVVNSPEIVQAAAPGDDAAEELIANLQTRPIPLTNYVLVTLEGTDPARTAKQLELLLKIFREKNRDEAQSSIEDSKKHADDSLKKLIGELAEIDRRINATLRVSTTVGPGGRNLLEDQWMSLGSMLAQKRARRDELRSQSLIAQLFPSTRTQMNPEEGARRAALADLEQQRRKLVSALKTMREKVRNFDTDHGARFKARQLEDILDEIKRLKAAPTEAGPDTPSAAEPLEAMVRSMTEEIRSGEDSEKGLLARFQESMPDHQKFLNDQEEHKMLKARIGDMQTKLSEFDILAKSQKTRSSSL